MVMAYMKHADYSIHALSKAAISCLKTIKRRSLRDWAWHKVGFACDGFQMQDLFRQEYVKWCARVLSGESERGSGG